MPTPSVYERVATERDDLRTKVERLQRELAAHVVWPRKDDDGWPVYECDLCDAKDPDAQDQDEVKHADTCMLSR